MDLSNAIQCICSGGVIAYPTESVYGLGCDPNCLDAVERIHQLKRRSPSKGLILLVDDIETATPWITDLTETQKISLNQARSVATTWLIPKHPSVSQLISGKHDSIAIRVTRHPIAREICNLLGGPLVSTSYNLNGEPSLSTYQDVKQDSTIEVDHIVEGICGGEPPSQIIDFLSQQRLR